MKKNRFLIIGVGSVGKELLGKLNRDIDVTCIDLSDEPVELVKEIRPDCNFVIGDATSRLVLEGAGAAEADCVVLTTTDEKVNTEVARILKEHFESKRVISIGTTKAGIEALEALEVEVENMFTASAIIIRNKLEQSTRAPHDIGIGKNEILEIEVHPSSRLANRPLRSLTPIRWRIGLIYRDENIIVPKNDTVLKPKDRVIILGEPGVLKTVSEILTFKFQRFPLEYGATCIAYLYGNEDEKTFDELDYIFSVLPLEKMIFIYSSKAAEKSDFYDSNIRREHIRNIEVKKASNSMFREIQETVKDLKGDQGLVFISRKNVAKKQMNFLINERRKKFLYELVRMADCPVLLSSGTFPYAKTAVPCVERSVLQQSLETALEISSSLNNEVFALLAKPSKYISSDEEISGFDEMKKTINETGLMYKSSVTKEILEGNPVRAITGALINYNLLVTDVGGLENRKLLTSLFTPDVMWHIIRNSEISTLILPQTEGSL